MPPRARSNRPRLLVLPLPTGEIGRRKLMTMALADFGHAGVVFAAGRDFAPDGVVALGLGHEGLQLFHRHGSNLAMGYFTAKRARATIAAGVWFSSS